MTLTGIARDAVAFLRGGLRAHWRSVVGLVGLLGFGALITFLLGQVGVLDLPFIARRWDSLWIFAWVGVGLTLTSFFLGFAFATPIGLVRAYASGVFTRRKGRPAAVVSFARARELYGTPKAVRVVGARVLRKALVAPAYAFATGYVEGIRGTPFYVQMWLVFFFAILAYPALPGWVQGGVAGYFNFLRYPRIPEEFYFAGLLALTLNTIGYQGEVLRAGFQSVDQGQIDAAKALGMRGLRIFRRITLPQALRLVILPLTNEWISLLKASSILSAIAVTELMFQSKQLGVNEGHPFEAFLMVAGMYLLINVTVGKTAAYLERKTRIPGLGIPGTASGTRRVRGRVPSRGREAAKN